MVVGTAAATVPTAMLMQRVGRRLGFVLGGVLAVGSALLGRTGAASGTLRAVHRRLLPDRHDAGVQRPAALRGGGERGTGARRGGRLGDPARLHRRRLDRPRAGDAQPAVDAGPSLSRSASCPGRAVRGSRHPARVDEGAEGSDCRGARVEPRWKTSRGDSPPAGVSRRRAGRRGRPRGDGVRHDGHAHQHARHRRPRPGRDRARHPGACGRHVSAIIGLGLSGGPPRGAAADGVRRSGDDRHGGDRPLRAGHPALLVGAGDSGRRLELPVRRRHHRAGGRLPAPRSAFAPRRRTTSASSACPPQRA